jgi:hypothetical protein
MMSIFNRFCCEFELELELRQLNPKMSRCASVNAE